MKKRRIICALISLALIFSALWSLASCQKQDRAIMSITDGEISKSIGESTYTFLLSRMRGTLDYYGYDVDDASFWRTVISNDNRTWDDHFSDTIFEQTKLYLTIEYLFEKEGLTLDESRVERVDATISGLIAVKGSRSALNAELKAFGVNVDMLRDIYLTEQKFSHLIAHFYGENGEKIEKGEKDRFYNENYVAFGYFFIPTYEVVVGEDGKEVTVELDAKKKSELQVQAAEYADIIDGNIDLFKEYCAEYGDVRGAEPTYLYVSPEYYASQDSASAHLDTIANALAAMATGQCEVISSPYGYYVICKYENEVGAYDSEKYGESFSDFYAMLSDKLFDEKCQEYADMITVYESAERARISSVATNKLY